MKRGGIIELSIDGKGPSRGFVFDPHRLALPCWAEVTGDAPSLLLTFDRHFDTVPPVNPPVAGSGNRTTGTVVGAAAGAAVGGAIGSAADNREARDYCEAYLDQYMSQQGRGGYVYGYQPMMMVPVMMVTVAGPVQQQGECKETIVTEEWVTTSVRSRRYVPATHVLAMTSAHGWHLTSAYGSNQHSIATFKGAPIGAPVGFRACARSALS